MKKTAKKRKTSHNYGFDISLQELSGRVGISYSHCRKIFRTGCNNAELAKKIQEATGGKISALWLLRLE